MYNKYYRLNESRWELPEENYDFKYPNYGYDKKDHNLLKDKNLEEGWDKHIIEELTNFYNEYEEAIVTEYEKLYDNNLYYYIDFSYLTSEEIIYIKRKKELQYCNWVFNEDEDKTYEVRRVIRKYPNLNPSNILFSFDAGYVIQYNIINAFKQSIKVLSFKLSCVLKLYCFQCINSYLVFDNKNIYFNGLYLKTFL